MLTFVTVPDEALAVARACAEHLKANGHLFKVEYSDESLPEAATLYVKDGREHTYYIFDSRIDMDRLILWSGFGRSCSSSTQVILCVSERVQSDAATIAKIRGLGIGLSTVDGNGSVLEVAAPADLSMHVELPPLRRHRPVIRRKLAKVHSKFERGDWKGGFESACKIVEHSARGYLAKYAKAERVQVVGKKGIARNVLPEDVERMPLGALKDIFCGKLMPTRVDSLLCAGLKKINSDRVNVAHEKLTARTERRLRDNVGKHMWTIDNLLLKMNS